MKLLDNKDFDNTVSKSVLKGIQHKSYSVMASFDYPLSGFHHLEINVIKHDRLNRYAFALSYNYGYIQLTPFKYNMLEDTHIFNVYKTMDDYGNWVYVKFNKDVIVALDAAYHYNISTQVDSKLEETLKKYRNEPVFYHTDILHGNARNPQMLYQFDNGQYFFAGMTLLDEKFQYIRDCNWLVAEKDGTNQLILDMNTYTIRENRSMEYNVIVDDERMKEFLRNYKEKRNHSILFKRLDGYGTPYVLQVSDSTLHYSYFLFDYDYDMVNHNYPSAHYIMPIKPLCNEIHMIRRYINLDNTCKIDMENFIYEK